MENNEMVTDTVKAEEVETVQPKEEKTFTREQLNRAIAAEKAKVREEVLAEIEAEKTEAERLASLTKDERHKEELRKATQEKNDALAKLNAYELKDQTIKDNPDLPVELINLIDFRQYNTADKVQEKLETIKAVYSKSLENGLNETLREKTPKTVVNGTTTKERVSRESY